MVESIRSVKAKMQEKLKIPLDGQAGSPMQSQLPGVPEGTLKGALRRASAGLSAKPSRSGEPCGALRLWLPRLPASLRFSRHPLSSLTQCQKIQLKLKTLATTDLQIPLCVFYLM
jgi:hypothetical protein